MDYKNYYFNYIDSISFLLKEINPELISKSVDLIKKKIKNNNKIYIVGNGGSASIASHISVDFTKVAKIKSLTFNNSNFITCFANDYGYENWVKEA
ncbi:MAG: Phosphoheptose isomerase, partial [Alphaproteobacteria bacterium MarineAlpha5_Bin7]